MEEKTWRYGCLLCRTGGEMTVADYINQTMIGIEVIAPTRIHRKTIAGKNIEDDFLHEHDDAVLP